MSSLPQINGPRLIRALKRAGFFEVRQVGSHLTLHHESDITRRATVPMHSTPVKPGTLHAILKGARITPGNLKDLM